MQKSDTIIELAKALAEFQGKLTAVKKDAINPFYKSKYATLDTIWEAIRKPLSESGLAITQTLNYADSKTTLETTLLHSSGEWLSGNMLVNPVKDDPQGLGSAISYARRYSLCAMLGIVADEDDDAETPTKHLPAKEEATKAFKQAKTELAKPITVKDITTAVKTTAPEAPTQEKLIDQPAWINELKAGMERKKWKFVTLKGYLVSHYPSVDFSKVANEIDAVALLTDEQRNIVLKALK